MKTKEPTETVALLHLPTRHRLVVIGDPLKVEVERAIHDMVSRVWESKPAGFYAFLRRQKNLRRMCPVCNKHAMYWEAKWNEKRKVKVALNQSALEV